jgi:hypothetical protein
VQIIWIGRANHLDWQGKLSGSAGQIIWIGRANYLDRQGKLSGLAGQ